MNLLDGLNSKQKEAVLQTDGPILVLAGAGSGKTRVLTSKIAYLLEKDKASKYEIVAITFTNKAAGEMKHRVSRLLNSPVDDMWIGTFHSICTRILRREISIIGYSSNFTIYDRDDQKSLVKEILREKNLDIKSFEMNQFLSILSNGKNAGRKPGDIDALYRNNPITKYYGEIYEEYINKSKKYNGLDFDDLILKVLEIFRLDFDTAKKYASRFKYVFVDEYQDTNKSQYELIKFLSTVHNNICVVGDGDQSIYGWRGADVSNILNFEKDYKSAKVILLEENYRSTSKILNVANRVIKNNDNRIDKQLWTGNAPGADIIYRSTDSESEEAITVINWLEHMKYNGYSFDEMAILYRTNAQSRSFEEGLVRAGINYHIVGGLKFYDRKEIKDLISYLKIIVNPDDNIALKRIINVPKRGIGDSSVLKLEGLANEQGYSLYESLFDDDIRIIGKKSLENIYAFRDMMERIKSSINKMTLSEFVEFVLQESGYMAALENSKLREDQTRIENLSSFINSIIDYEEQEDDPTLENYLASVSLLSDVDKTDDSTKGVSLMTVHASKGMEYKVVILTGMDEGLFPSIRSIEENDGIEEERRLCYVAITRAEERLFITGSRTRRIFGQTKYTEESTFITEMEDTIVNDSPIKRNIGKIEGFNEEYSPKRLETKNKLKSSLLGINTLDNSCKNEQNIRIGDKIKHKVFGVGTIISIIKKEDGDELTISFDGMGIKKLNKNIAPIERI